MNTEMWIRALKAARAGAGVSQDGLASAINWSTSTIAAIETGRRRPTRDFAVAVDARLETAGLPEPISLAMIEKLPGEL